MFRRENGNGSTDHGSSLLIWNPSNMSCLEPIASTVMISPRSVPRLNAQMSIAMLRIHDSLSEGNRTLVQNFRLERVGHCIFRESDNYLEPNWIEWFLHEFISGLDPDIAERGMNPTGHQLGFPKYIVHWWHFITKQNIKSRWLTRIEKQHAILSSSIS